MTNTDIARQLQEQARQLAQGRGNLYRIRAYRRAANAVLGLERPVANVSREALQSLPGVGDHLALAITNYVRTGEWKTFEELTSANLAV